MGLPASCPACSPTASRAQPHLCKAHAFLPEFPLCGMGRSLAWPCAVAFPVPPYLLETHRRGVHSSFVHAGSPSAQAIAYTVLATPHKPPRECPSKNPALSGRRPAQGHRAAPKTRARVPDPAQGKQAAGGRKNPLYPENRRMPGRTAFCKEDPPGGLAAALHEAEAFEAGTEARPGPLGVSSELTSLPWQTRRRVPGGHEGPARSGGASADAGWPGPSHCPILGLVTAEAGALAGKYPTERPPE